MRTIESVTRWSGAFALVLSGFAVWRAESGAAPVCSTKTTAAPVVAPEKSPAPPVVPSVTAPAVAPPIVPAPAIAPVATPAVVAPPVARTVAAVEPEEEDNVELAPSSALQVKRVVVTHGIEDHEPVDLAGTLSLQDNASVTTFIEVANRSDLAGRVQIDFQREGARGSVGHVSLRVPANTARYRTWGFTRMVRTPGHWTAIIRGNDGHELGRRDFEVTE